MVNQLSEISGWRSIANHALSYSAARNAAGQRSSTMESQQIKRIVAEWRKQKVGPGNNFEWTLNAHIFFDGARAAAKAVDNDSLVAEIDMLQATVDTQGINPLLAMAQPERISPLEQNAIDMGVEFNPERNSFGR
jgi:hypothetical protein